MLVGKFELDFVKKISCGWGPRISAELLRLKHSRFQPYRLSEIALTSTATVHILAFILSFSPHTCGVGRGTVTMPAPPSTYKASKRRKRDSPPATSSNELERSDKKVGTQSPAFPLVAFFWPARKNTSQWVILPLVLMFVGLFRWCAGFWGYSGTDLSAISWVLG